MKKITVTIAREIAQNLEDRAFDEGITLEDFLTKAIEQNVDKLIRPRKWMPLEKWNAVSKGENCSDCAHLLSGKNPYGFPVAKLSISRLDLMKSQFVPGACILYCNRHVTEPYELSNDEQLAVWGDIVRSAKVLVKVFQPIKMNYQILGNSGPHLHVYLQPRFYGDSEPGWPIDPFKEQVILSDSEYQERVRSIQDALASC